LRAVADLWDRHRRTLGVALLLVVPVMFSVNQLVARAVHDFFPPFALAFWRWAGAGLVMLAFTGGRLWRQRRIVRREWPELAGLGFLGMFVCGAFVYIGGQTTTATNIGLIYAMTPVAIIAIGGAFYGERLATMQKAGVALALLGVLAIICKGDPGVLLGLAFTAGDLWIATAATCWAIYSVLLARRHSALGLAERFTAICLGGALILAPFTLWEAVQGEIAPLDLRSIAVVALVVLVPSLGAYQGYALVQRALGPGVAGLVAYLSPVYNAGLAWALLDEVPQWFHLAGAALVLPGIYLATRR
jgi:drug/metabolite transporter (DMT)-like permease